MTRHRLSNRGTWSLTLLIERLGLRRSSRPPRPPAPRSQQPSRAAASMHRAWVRAPRPRPNPRSGTSAADESSILSARWCTGGVSRRDHAPMSTMHAAPWQALCIETDWPSSVLFLALTVRSHRRVGAQGGAAAHVAAGVCRPLPHQTARRGPVQVHVASSHTISRSESQSYSQSESQSQANLSLARALALALALILGG